MNAQVSSDEKLDQIDLDALSSLGRKLEADFYIRRAYDVESLKLIGAAAREIIFLRDACAGYFAVLRQANITEAQLRERVRELEAGKAPLTYETFWQTVAATGWNPTAEELRTLITLAESGAMRP
jgi:hypothetical protein